jgi:hypothetical protein
MNTTNLDIIIDPEDLKLGDHDLYLKLYNHALRELEMLPDFNFLQEEITRSINYARGRKICKVCDGAGMVNRLKCLGYDCRGGGYIA